MQFNQKILNRKTIITNTSKLVSKFVKQAKKRKETLKIAGKKTDTNQLA